jgi:hypothetical protein
MVSVAELPELDVVELCARTEGIIVLKRAREETNAVVHDAEDKGKRAIVEMVELVYVERRKRNRAMPLVFFGFFSPSRGSKFLELAQWKYGNASSKHSTVFVPLRSRSGTNVSKPKTLL